MNGRGDGFRRGLGVLAFLVAASTAAQQPTPSPLGGRPKDVTLESLVRSPGARDGQLVRVVGRFRGRNLYRDLPAISQRRRADWVIKDGLFAAWVTGRPPRGEGFDLDADDKRDTDQWLEVVGRVQTMQDVTYLRAEGVRAASPPTPAVAAPKEATPGAATPPGGPSPAPVPRIPRPAPMVIFSLPVDGDDGVPPDGRFVVQFSADMHEETFRERVVLRYAGPARPGDPPSVDLRLGYERNRRALTVEPVEALAPGRWVELVLFPGITDVDGAALAARPGAVARDGVDVLRFRITR